MSFTEIRGIYFDNRDSGSVGSVGSVGSDNTRPFVVDGSHEMPKDVVASEEVIVSVGNRAGSRKNGFIVRRSVTSRGENGAVSTDTGLIW